MRVIQQSFKIVQVSFITGDPGEEPAIFKANWSADEEPIAAIIDNSISNGVKLKANNNEIEEE
jgi:hypothetical protein